MGGNKAAAGNAACTDADADCAGIPSEVSAEAAAEPENSKLCLP